MTAQTSEQLAPVIHVAGTKGKGSTVATMRACLEAAGYRVHAYISPHLVRFHERIRLAGRLIEEDALTALLEECEHANGDAPITFFEITTAAAFLAFAISCCSKSGSAAGSMPPMSCAGPLSPQSHPYRSTTKPFSAIPSRRSPAKRRGS